MVTSARRGVAGFVLALALAGVPHPAWAQAGWYVNGRFSVAEEYNDNIFFTTQKTGDFITQFTPGFDIGYRSEPLTFLLGYQTTIEVYADNSDLNNIGDNQNGRLIFRYAPDRRLTMGLGGSFTRSLTTPSRVVTQGPPAQQNTAPAPSDSSTTTSPVPAPSGSPTTTSTAPANASAAATGNDVVFFGVGRQETLSFSVVPSVSYVLDPLTTLHATYAFTYLDVQDQPSQTSQSAGLGVDRTVTQRLTGTANYLFRLFDSEDSQGGTFTSTAHSLTVGGRYQVTERLGVDARAGPSFVQAEESSVTLEAAAGLRYVLRDGFLSLDYRRTQALVVGVTGARTVNIITGSFRYQLTREMSAYVLPSASINARNEGEDLNIYEMEAGISYQLNRWLSASLRYHFTWQQQGSSEVNRHEVTVGLDFADTWRLY